MNVLRRLVSRGREAGAGGGGGTSLTVLIACLGLLLIFGLVVDGGTQAGALDRANQLAVEAARSALQVPPGPGGHPDPAAVNDEVSAFLSTAGAAGSARVAGDTVWVTCRITAPTKVLGMIGIDHLTVTGTGSADLVYR